MTGSRTAAPKLFAVAAMLAASVDVLAAPVNLLAMDPPGYTTPYAETLETLNFPLLAMLGKAPGWAAALRADPALQALAGARAQRVVAAATCTARPDCIAAAWLWLPGDVAVISDVLRAVAARPGMARALVQAQMRPSGRFARHAGLADADLLAAAWADTAAGLNNLVAVYGQGKPPRYPLIDAAIFDVARPEFALILNAHAQITAAAARADDLVFDPALRFGTGLLRINERTDAAAYRPLLAGANGPAIAAVRRTRWLDYRYPALLVFGHGPDDAQSRTGVLGHIRLARAADLYARRLAPFIIVSGGNVHPNRTPFNEAAEMKQLLITQYNIPADHVLIEPHARHTTTNLRNSARLLFAAGFPTDRPALIVTDPMTASYIGSQILAERTLKETGIAPGRVSAAETPFAFEFLTDRAAFHVEPLDPLDP
ncbi:YdcF family protein [Sandarakinorhabdus sp.]|uniref:YdcF family protein n=1 Tax=Sandarakinorhabdus sp. TaxID=1916663 RepID=UPI00333E4F57